MSEASLNDLLTDEELHLQKLHQLVEDSMREEELLSSRLLEIESDSDATIGQKAADMIATFGGSWTFIILFVSVLVIWIFFNGFVLLNRAFDPYPFILLNLVLSCIAALQAPIIMMSQNRQEDKDRVRARSDYMVNLKAEMEVRNLHRKIDLLIADEMRHLFDIQRAQLEMLGRIERSLGSRG